MKVTLGELRNAIREEYMRGMENFVVTEAANKYTDELMQHIKRHILMTKNSPREQREAMYVAREVLKDLKDEVEEMTKEKLWTFMMSV